MDNFVLGQDVPHFTDQLCEYFFQILAADPQCSAKNRSALRSHHIFLFFDSVQILVFARLPDILVSEDPPRYEDLLETTSIADIPREILLENYLIYILIAEKDGEPPMAAVGSAANKTKGSTGRVKDYTDGRVYMFPLRLREALENGYEITHIGVLVMLKVPKEARLPIVRCFVLYLETSFTYVLWTLYQGRSKNAIAVDEKLMTNMCPWDIESLEWDGLNTHSPLQEGIHNLELSQDEIVRIAEEAKRKRRQNETKWRNRNRKLGKEVAERRQEDPSFVPTSKELTAVKYFDRVKSYRVKTSANESEILRIRNAFLSGELEENPTEEQMKKINRVSNSYEAQNESNRKDSALLAQFRLGDLPNPTQEEQERIDRAQHTYEVKRKSRTGTAPVKPRVFTHSTEKENNDMLKLYNSGQLPNPTGRQRAMIKKAEKRKEQRKALRAEKRKQKQEAVDDGEQSEDNND